MFPCVIPFPRLPSSFFSLYLLSIHFFLLTIPSMFLFLSSILSSLPCPYIFVSPIYPFISSSYLYYHIFSSFSSYPSVFFSLLHRLLIFFPSFCLISFLQLSSSSPLPLPSSIISSFLLFHPFVFPLYLLLSLVA